MIDPAVLETVSLPLAVQDALPVALSAAGMVVLARGIGQRLGPSHGRVAMAGAVLIGMAGACKVGWKIGVAAFEVDLFGLQDWLFPLLAAGFVILAGAVRRVRRGASQAEQPWTLAVAGAGTLLSILAFTFVDLDAGLLYAMVIAIGGSLWLSWMLIRIAVANRDRVAGILVEVNVVATFVLAGLARIEVQSLGLQWIEQSINTVSQGLFLLAATRLAAHDTRWGTVVEPKEPIPAVP